MATHSLRWIATRDRTVALSSSCYRVPEIPGGARRQHPADTGVHVVMDKAGTDKTPAVKRWFARHPRFTPTAASWIKQVECRFAQFTRKQIRQGTHRSTRQLEQAIRDYLAIYNMNPHPFVWTKTADQILDAIKRFYLRISDSRH